MNFLTNNDTLIWIQLCQNAYISWNMTVVYGSIKLHLSVSCQHFSGMGKLCVCFPFYFSLLIISIGSKSALKTVQQFLRKITQILTAVVQLVVWVHHESLENFCVLANFASILKNELQVFTYNSFLTNTFIKSHK